MLFVELKKHIESGQLKPCYLITGEDKYLVNRARTMFAATTQMREMNCTSLGSDATIEEIICAAESLPFMSDRRVVELVDYSRDLSGLEKYLSSPNPTTVLLLICDGIGKNLSNIYKYLQVVDCARPDEKTVTSYIARKCSDAGVQISVSAARKLIEYTGRYMASVDNEIDKLIAYKDGGTIETQDVEALVSPTMEFKIYELADAIANASDVRAVTLLRRLIAEGNQPASLTSLIYSYFRRLLYVAITSGDSVASDLGIKPFAVNIASRQAKNFTPVKLKRICDNLSVLDQCYKSGRSMGVAPLEKFILSTVNEAKR